MWLVLLFIVLSAAFRSLQEIAKWRPGRSWIPRWFFDYRGPINLDPYHFVSALHWISMFFAGIVYFFNIGFKYYYAIIMDPSETPIWLVEDWFLHEGWWHFVVVWLIHGAFNDLFYHFIWMKRDYWFT